MASLPLVQIFDSNGDELKQLEQWDSDRVLEFRGIDPFTLADIDVIQVGVVGHLNAPEAVPMVREDANIIKITLPGWKFTRYGQPLIFYGYEQMGAGEMRTVFAVTMPLARRLKPISYSDAEWERQQAEIAREELAAEMATATDAANAAADAANTAADAANTAADAANTAAERAEDAAEHAEEVIATARVFVAVYGETTFAEIEEAIADDKAVIVRHPRNGAEGILTGDRSGDYVFYAYPHEYRVTPMDAWIEASMLDNAPTANSGKLVTSGGIYNALQGVTGAFWAEYGVTHHTEVRAAIAAQKPVFVIHNDDFYRLESTADEDFVFTSIDSKGIKLSPYDVWSEFVAADIEPTEDSMRLITSGSVFDALQDKQDVVAFDDEPTEGSANPVTSDGIYVALQNIDTTGIVDSTLTQAGKAADAEVVGVRLDEVTDFALVYSNTVPAEEMLFYPGSNISSRYNQVENPEYSLRVFNVSETGWYKFISAAIYRQERYYVYSQPAPFMSANYLRQYGPDVAHAGGLLLNAGEYIVGRAFSTNFNFTAVYCTEPSVVLEPTLPLTPTMTQEVETLLSGKQNTLTWDTTPTAGSLNPVTSNGIYAALETKVDKVTGKGLSTNDYTDIDKAKVNAMPTATSALTNDSDFQTGTEVNDAIAAALGSMTSLQYEIVTELPATGAAGTVYLIQNGLSYDQYMWIGGQYYNIGSTAVDLSGYYTIPQTDTLIAGKQDTLTFDAVPTVLSTNPVTSGGVFNALADKQDTLVYDNVPTADSVNTMTSGGIYNALQGKQNLLIFDPTPTNNSPNPVKSGGVYTALGFKQDVLVFDSIPTLGSPNPVTSAGVWSALRNKQDAFDFDTAPLRGSLNAVTSNGIYEALQGRTTPAQVQQAINDAMADFTEFDYAIVAALPAVGEKGVVYFVPDSQNPSISNQYLWIEETPSGHYEQIGSTAVDLSDYYTKTETDALIDEVRIFEAQINVTSAADIIQAVNDRKSIVVHSGAGSPSEFAVKAAISGEKVYLYTMTLNVGSPRSYPVFTRHVIEGTTWAVTNVGGAVTDDVPFIAEQGRTTPPQIEMATAKNRIIVVKATDGVYYPCTNVSTTADHHTRLHCLNAGIDEVTDRPFMQLLVFDVYGATWSNYVSYMVTAIDLQEAVDELNDRINAVEATIGRFRGNYGSYALLAADSRSHRENDYAIVTVDETHANQCWYYTFSSDSVWVARFKIRDAAFTSAQMDAINSGATTAKIDSIANKVDKVTTSGKTEVYIHSGTTQTVREIATSITSADASKLPTVAAVYNNRRVNGVAADAGSTALDFDALLAKCGLNSLGNGHSWAYCRQFNSCTDRPFNSDAVYIELWGRDNTTFIVHVVDWIAQRDAWRTKNNGTWGSWSLINNRASGNSAVAYTNYSSNFTTMEDYTGVTRQAWRAGSQAGVAFHLKCKCTTACTNDWYYIGTVAEHFRPQARVAINCTLWSMGEGSTSIGGDINTDGRIRVWINTLATNTNVQFRVNASWMIN